MRNLLIGLGLAASALGCSSPTGANPSELAGRWQNARESLQPAGSYQTTLTFDGEGRVTVDVRSYGSYPGQGADDLAAYSRLSGTFRTDADALIIHAEELASWDRFYGADSPEQTRKAAPSESVYSQAHYSVQADRLTLHYLSAPADLPIPTTATFVRIP